MKILKQITYIAVTIFTLTSCGDFLDRQPLDQITVSNFYNNADEAELAAISMYAVPQGINWHGKAWMILEIPSDNSTVGGNDPDFSPIDNFTISDDNVPNTEFWTERFRLVTLANQVINFTPPIDMDAEQKAAIIAEARTMRAYAYFDLVRIYGGVPIIQEVPTIDSELNVMRSEVNEVYDFIIADLEAGMADLPAKRSGGDVGRASGDMAAALLAKVYLTQDNYQECMSICRDLIASGRYQLTETFDENWLRETSDNNEESIFQIQYVGCGPGNTGNALQGFFAPWGQAITGGADGWGSQVPTAPNVDNPGTTIRDAYSNDDLRQYHTIMTPGTEYPMINDGYSYPATGASRTSCNIKKYVIGGGSDVCFLSTPQNFHVIRYADVLLMLAEASAKNGGGLSVTPDVIDAFNEVHTRAGLEPVGSITTESVLHERRLEFAFENQRWFDLLRHDNLRNRMLLHGKQMQEFHRLFPIPVSELSVNPNLVQNPGY